jgi:hypothetical protein
MRQVVARARRAIGAVAFTAGLLVLGGVIFNGTVSAFTTRAAPPDQRATVSLFEQGKQVFRYDTFGDEAFWGDALQLNRAIAGAKNGGVGPGVSPKTALSVGLKVDASAIPAPVATAIKAGKVNLDDPKTTLALLKMNAVVGVKGFFSRNGQLSSMGITCALCHSTVDDSFAPGIGKRLDGWPNRDLNVGAIVSLAPNKKPITDLLQVDEPTVGKVLASWGPGKYDAQLFLDGKGLRPDGKTAATLIPPAYGLAGVNLHTSTGWGSVPYWNAFVAIIEMHGKGNFEDSRLSDAKKFPVAARAGFDHIHTKDDRVTSKLPALQFYQLALKAPTPPPSSYDAAAAKRGKALFMGKGRCADCHVPPTFTESGFNMHKPSETCTDSFQADRSPDGMYRTTPLRGAWAHAKGGFYHDGRYQNFVAVVDHYDSCFNLGLAPGEKADLVQYLKSL